MSAVLYALAALTSSSFQLQPNLPTSSQLDEEETPVTSLLSQWKIPKRRKESTLSIMEARFEKHDYANPTKRRAHTLEGFDPRPEEFKGSAVAGLPDLLDKLKGEQLCISLLLDPSYQQTSTDTIPPQPSSQRIPDIDALKRTVQAFIESLQISEEKCREIERNTRKQNMSSLWFSVRQYRITASLFGSVLTRRTDTPPDNLVLQILQPRSFSTAATKYGMENEQMAIKEYIDHQNVHGHPELVVSASGFLINTAYPFLGASPDGAVHDPSNVQQPFGFLEVKCPYSFSNKSVQEACSTSSIFCEMDDSTGQIKLKESHQYYAQVQGQMGVGGRPWCDFVVYTKKDKCSTHNI